MRYIVTFSYNVVELNLPWAEGILISIFLALFS